ncbi:MAG: type II toxin-antitoxin system VapB family antitoxin [Alphaproteobacteria bacterium]|nr:type II toxin-antitoxin system VapB family antitoxin [Alphaproteobacteria bacterium]MBU2378434.1 type II toxin-antitoxin system VapB family antitoxin [Alphaproteobacteria bacterium]
MGLSIKRAETERKARAVAARMGVGVTEAIDRALDDKWRDLTADERRLARRGAIEDWLKGVDARQRSAHRTLRDIETELYDENGNAV